MISTHKSVFAAAVLLLFAVLSACSGGEQQPKEQAADQKTEVETQAADTTISKLNVNTASEEQFKTLPNVGERMAHEFVEYRPYVSILQFRKEIGKYVSDEQVAAYEKYIYVPIDFNKSDSETLQQIPGLEAGEAMKLIAGRPYHSKGTFLGSLSVYVKESELETAKRYLK